MSAITDDVIRRQILEILMDSVIAEPTGYGVNRNTLMTALRVPERSLDFNMVFLSQRGLVQLIQATNVPWLWARITPLGIDAVRNKKLYEKRFPFLMAGGPEAAIYTPIVEAADARIVFLKNLADTLQKARKAVDAREGAGKRTKAAANKVLSQLEEELRKEQVDAGKVQKIWGRLKTKAGWVAPVLTDLVYEALKRAL